MPTFQRCAQSVTDMAKRVMLKFERHQPLIAAKVAVDFVFAYGDKDDLGNILTNALTTRGVRALGICRKLSLKDRAMNRGDAEISIDGDWWDDANDAEREALLDHELYHIEVKTEKKGGDTVALTDDLNRPVLKLRPHDYEVGWFTCVAKDHGMFSQERKYAQAIMDEAGQYYWPMTASDRVITVDSHGNMSGDFAHLLSKSPLVEPRLNVTHA